MKEKIRQSVVLKGRVQGVGARYKIYYLAQNYGVTGWVRNEYDGSVLAQMQGLESEIDMILQGLGQDRYIVLDSVERKQIPLETEERGFQILN